MVIDNSAYSALIENMTEIAKRQIASNSEILSFNVNRRQVKKEKSLNSLGSPQNPEVFSDETISHPILGSINEMNEVPITVSGGSSGIKYLTASDVGLSEQTAGTYQYELSISIVDGFVPTVKKLLKKLYRTSNDVSDYIALLDIPDNYDSARQVAKLSVREAKTDEMSKTYVDALSYFKNMKNIETEYKRASSLIASRGATKESIGLFQKRLNSVISKAEALISKTGTGATPSGVANQPSNSSLPNSPTVEIKQSFNNTVSVECKDDKYIDYFPGKGKIGGGLNIFTSTEVKNSTPETIYLETPSTSLEMLESRGVTFSIVPVSETYAIDTSPQKLVSTKKYISEDSQTVGGLLQDDLSPIDLSEVSVGSLVSTDEINMAVSSIAPKLSSVSTFQAPVGNITKVMPKVIETSGIVSSKAGISTSMPKGITTEGVMSSGANTSMQGTMVLVATQTSEPPTCSADSPAPILKSPEWKPIEEVADAKGTVVLCKQDNGLDEVSNGYFIMEMK
tara:strand:- start:28 stop:1557 length:1530 start_codon:yes stop_codon:yes gene_type:complete